MAHLQAQDYALVIGVNDYPRYGKNGRDLKGAVPDAKRFAAWLTNRDTGGGLPDANCKRVTSTNTPLEPTQTVIDTALEDIWTAARANCGRRFYFFFSGHGQTVDNPNFPELDVALCLPFWSRMRPDEALSSNGYREFARRCMPFTEVVSFLDCCKVPAVKARAFSTKLRCTSPHDGFEDVRRLVIHAAEHEKQAFETEVNTADADDEGGDDAPVAEVRGYFTSALIAALEWGAARPEGGVTQEALWAYLKAEVPRMAKESGHIQNPKISDHRLEPGAVFGAARPPAGPDSPDETNFEIRFSEWRTGRVTLLDSAAKIVKEGDPGEGPWRVYLKYELHKLIDEESQENLDLRFRPEMEGKHVTF